MSNLCKDFSFYHRVTCERSADHEGPHSHGPFMWDWVTFRMNFLEDYCASIRSKVRCQFPRDHIGPHLAEIDEVTVLMWEKF